MSAIEKILERFDAVELPSGHYQIAFVTPEEFKAALAEAYARGFDDGADVLGALARIEKHGQASNPWRKS